MREWTENTVWAGTVYPLFVNGAVVVLKPQPRPDRFVSSAVYDLVIPDDHFLFQVNERVDLSFVNELVDDTYCQDSGRKVTNEPVIMAKALSIQYHYNYSDRDMEENANTNLVIKWFLGYNLFEKPFHFTALSRFRDRLGEDGCREMLFQVNKQIEDAGIIVPGESQTIDATDVRSKTAPLSVPQMIYK